VNFKAQDKALPYHTKGESRMDWRAQYTKAHKPKLAEVNEYLAEDVKGLFAEFNGILKSTYGLGYVVIAYSDTSGWKYKYGHSGLILVNNVCFHDGIFSVEGIDVVSKSTLDAAIAKVDEMHRDGFMDRFAVFSQKRSERTKQKIKPSPRTGKNLNDCRWPAMVSRRDLQKLYENDASGILDEALLDNIGFTLYTRCREAREIYELMEAGKVKCLHCGSVLDYADIMECSCGQQYTYREYRKSYRANNMPRGEASGIFDRFTADWEKAHDSVIKMRLIDNLIHEFHVSSIAGTKNRPVGVNLIQGTKEQVTTLIEALAYSNQASE
jgi:hypothetical protein